MVAVVLDSGRAKVSHFYVWMAATCALVAFGTFAPIYWLQVPAGTFAGLSFLHVHGLLFSAWTLLLGGAPFFVGTAHGAVCCCNM